MSSSPSPARTPAPTVEPDLPTWVPVAAVAVTLLLWASAFVAIRHLGDDFSPGALSLGRLLVGAACLAAVALPRGLARPAGRDLLGIVLIGVLWFGVYNVALNAGERRVDAGTAAMLIQVSPVLIAVLATVALAEPFTRTLGAGLALAFSGVAVIALAGQQPGVSGHDVVGVGLCLLSAVVYSVSVVMQKPIMARVPAVQVTWLACTVGAIACLPFAPALVREVGAAPASSVGWLVYLGVFPTAIAFTTYAVALRQMSASSLGVTTYLVPPITIVLGWAFLGETPPALAYLGGVVALLGVAVARRRAPVRVPAPAEPAEAA